MVVEPEEIYDGLAISFYLTPYNDIPSMNFFCSKHCFGVYKQPSLLPLTTFYATGEVFGCAIDVAVVHSFCKNLAPLGRKINNTGRCHSDNPDFHGSYLALNERGKELLETMHQRMEDFAKSGDWIDDSIEVVDCLDHWDPAKFSEVLALPMTEDEALEALQAAQDAAQDKSYRIIGDVYSVLQVYYELWLVPE